MIKLNDTQKNWLNAAYNKAFRESSDNRFALRFVSNLFKASRLNPTFESPDGETVGIAALPASTNGIDPTNPEEAIDLVLASQLSTYLDSDGNLDSLVEGDVEEIVTIEKQLDVELFANDDTFTSLNSAEGRFKRAMGSANSEALTGVVDEMINNRVNQRNRVIQNG